MSKAMWYVALQTLLQHHTPHIQVSVWTVGGEGVDLRRSRGEKNPVQKKVGWCMRGQRMLPKMSLASQSHASAAG